MSHPPAHSRDKIIKMFEIIGIMIVMIVISITIRNNRF